MDTGFKKQCMEVFFTKIHKNSMPPQPDSGPFLSDTLSIDLIYAVSVS
jgi:hypothetical protein